MAEAVNTDWWDTYWASKPAVPIKVRDSLPPENLPRREKVECALTVFAHFDLGELEVCFHVFDIWRQRHWEEHGVLPALTSESLWAAATYIEEALFNEGVFKDEILASHTYTNHFLQRADKES